MTKSILFTGGGTAGHVTPNIALILRFREMGWNIDYIGSHRGIERRLIEELEVPYHPISTGKLSRFFTWSNFSMPFRVLWGLLQATRLMLKLKPDVVFSKGGFVSVPVVVAAWLNRIPVVIHEADITPGLANRLSLPFAKQVCVTTDAAMQHYPNQHKVKVTGIPIRPSLLNGDKQRGLQFLGFSDDKPVVFVCGGSLGALALNKLLRPIIPKLTEFCQVAHMCGDGKTDPQFDDIPNYRQLSYLNHELADVMAAADLVISRAGANAVYEIVALKKPNLLIPLPLSASRGDQIENAAYYAEKGLSEVVEQQQLTPQLLLEKIKAMLANADDYQAQLAKFPLPDSTSVISGQLESYASQ